MSRALTRREALAAGVGAAVTLTAPTTAVGRTATRFDVAIVGAGFAGLAAARALTRAGATVVVLEARDRVGGRVQDASLGGGEVAELGGQWIGPGQDRIAALASDAGVATFPTHDAGQYLSDYQGVLSPYRDLIPPLPEEDALEFFNTLVELETTAAGVSTERPADSDAARALDQQTVEDFKGTLSTPGARFLIDLFCQTTLAAEARDLSYLHVLFYAAAAGEGNGDGFVRLSSIEGGAQERRFVGGGQRLAQRVAGKLPTAPRLRSAVRLIERNAQGVELCTDTQRILARRAIVAMSPLMAGKINHYPALPGLRAQLQTGGMPNGRVIKLNAVYAQPFWRDAGLSGYTTADNGPVRLTYDNSPPDGAPGVLVGFIEGADADYWRRQSAGARREAVIAQLVRRFGSAAAQPQAYVEKDWTADPWTRGCYGGYFGPGGWTSYQDVLRAPVGPVHWAGTETATAWMGYMDGAAQSGERAAAEVLAQL